MITNTKPVYAEYISGLYTKYHTSEAEAIVSVSQPDNGVEFNDSWFHAEYTEYLPGTLCLHNFSTGSVCPINDRDSTDHQSWFMPVDKVSFAFDSHE